MAAFKDYYDILGIARDADDKAIRSAFRRLAAKHHPDRNPDDPSAEERFKEVNEAYTVLSDAEKRRFYDQYGRTGTPPPPGAGAGGTVFTTVEGAEDFSDFFRSLFGGGFTSAGGFGGAAGFGGGDPFAGTTTRRVIRGGRHVAPRPAGAEATLEVGLEEAYRGGVQTIRIGQTGLDVTLPTGVRDGARLRLRGQAPDGGDLILTIRHAPHDRYRLEGDTVHVAADVPDHVAVLGGTVRVPTLDGDVEMGIPAGSRAGRRLRLRGRGWPKPDGSRGDAVAEARIVVPERATEEQRALYERLRELSSGSPGDDGV
jgi:curved DNA-binding protein